jgi:PAS domain S-box-containing protein
MRTDRTRLINHGIALALVAAAAAIRVAISGTDPATAFLLFSCAIAAASWRGGPSPGIVAVFAALLAARLISRADLTASLLFFVEGCAIVGLTNYASRAVTLAAAALASADARIRGLLAVQAALRRSDAAARRLEAVAVESAALVVDDRWRIVEWRDSATRLFGWTADAISGQGAERLFAAEPASVEQLLATAADAGASFEGVLRRADGSSFNARIEVHRLSDSPSRDLTVVVRDRSQEEEWAAFAEASGHRQAALREEADAAQRQLETLQHVTDPELNLLPTAQAITTLLDRLRAAIESDGVAVIRRGGPRRQIFTASEGLKPEFAVERRQSDGWPPQPGRILIVHNDAARVRAASVAGWCEEASSLIAVPIVSGSHAEGTIEAVRIKARRSSEWEIALVQVVAAQLAGRLQNASMFGADAVA